MGNKKIEVPQEVTAGEDCLTEEEMDEIYQIDMSIISGETMAEISFIENDIAVKTRDLQDIPYQLEILNMKLLLEQEKLNGVNLVLSVIEKGGINYLRRNPECQAAVTLEDAQ